MKSRMIKNISGNFDGALQNQFKLEQNMKPKQHFYHFSFVSYIAGRMFKKSSNYEYFLTISFFIFSTLHMPNSGWNFQAEKQNRNNKIIFNS